MLIERTFYLLLLVLLSASSLACVGPFQAPLAQAPLFSRAGEAEIGVGVRPFAPRHGLAAAARVALTDHLRGGAMLSGAVARRALDLYHLDGQQVNERHLALYGEAFIGAENRARLFRYGGLLGGGYGVTDYVYRTCDERGDMVREGWGPPRCYGEITHRENPRYLRVYVQPYLGISPPGVYKGALGMRFPVVHDLRSKETRALPEAFLSHSLLLRHVRFELQVVVAADQLVTLQLAAYVRLGPGASKHGSYLELSPATRASPP